MIRETKKKQRAFKIGIFTVVLVVSVITMLKSVVDCSPILFVRIGQEAVGSIDFKLQSPLESNAMISGDVNYYAIDPFNNPFKIKRDKGWPFPDNEADMPKPDPDPPENYHGELVASTEKDGLGGKEL